jgi:MFS family permease
MSSVLGAYRRVLANRALTRLLLGEFISSVGDWLYLVALLIIVYDRSGHDAVLLGVVGAARILPYVFLSVPAGILADRVDRRMILLITDIARGLSMLVLAWLVATTGPIEAIVAVTIAATCFSSFFGPAIGSYLPTLVSNEADLGPANTTYATLENIAFIIGPALAALIISVSDLTVAFLLNAGTFAVIAAILWRLPPSRAGQLHPDRAQPAAGDGAPTATDRAPTATDRAAATTEREAAATTDREAVATDGKVVATDGKLVATDGKLVARESWAGDPRVSAHTPSAPFSWRAIARPIGALMAIDVVESFVFGGVGVLTVVIAFELLGADSAEEGTGALNAAVGVGGLIGALVSGTLVLRRRLAPPLLLGAAILAGSVLLLGQSSSLLLAMLAMGAAAVGSLLMSVVATTLFQRIVPDEARGRAIGVVETVSVLAFAAGSLVLPTAVEYYGLGPVLLVSGAALALAAGIATPLLGQWAIQTPPEDEVRARLARVPIFSGLSPAALERAERRASVINVAPGHVIIRQGDEADRFYVIVDGSVEVTQGTAGAGAPAILRSMGAGEVFGEIGLLTGVPRTATVTATTECTLLALDKADFLELVAASSGLTFPLLDAHRGATVGG